VPGRLVSRRLVATPGTYKTGRAGSPRLFGTSTYVTVGRARQPHGIKPPLVGACAACAWKVPTVSHWKVGHLRQAEIVGTP